MSCCSNCLTCSVWAASFSAKFSFCFCSWSFLAEISSSLAFNDAVSPSAVDFNACSRSISADFSSTCREIFSLSSCRALTASLHWSSSCLCLSFSSLICSSRSSICFWLASPSLFCLSSRSSYCCFSSAALLTAALRSSASCSSCLILDKLFSCSSSLWRLALSAIAPCCSTLSLSELFSSSSCYNLLLSASLASPSSAFSFSIACSVYCNLSFVAFTSLRAESTRLCSACFSLSTLATTSDCLLHSSSSFCLSSVS